VSAKTTKRQAHGYAAHRSTSTLNVIAHTRVWHTEIIRKNPPTPFPYSFILIFETERSSPPQPLEQIHEKHYRNLRQAATKQVRSAAIPSIVCLSCNNDLRRRSDRPHGDAAEGHGGSYTIKPAPSRIPALGSGAAEDSVTRPSHRGDHPGPAPRRRRWSASARVPSNPSCRAHGLRSYRVNSLNSSPAGACSTRYATSFALYVDKVHHWLAQHSRWTFHFSVVSPSRLNTFEGFFENLTKQRLERSIF
jgi:hypothetical protein